MVAGWELSSTDRYGDFRQNLHVGTRANGVA